MSVARVFGMAFILHGLVLICGGFHRTRFGLCGGAFENLCFNKAEGNAEHDENENPRLFQENKQKREQADFFGDRKTQSA